MRSMKNVAVLTEDGPSVLFFVPTTGDLTAQHFREFAIQGKKNANTRESAREGGGGGGGAGRSWD